MTRKLPPEITPEGTIVMPTMRGFECPVEVPFMGVGPHHGIGVGWSMVEGRGPMFFVSVQTSDGFALTAQLDFEQYRRLAQNLASCGKAAMAAVS